MWHRTACWLLSAALALTVGCASKPEAPLPVLSVDEILTQSAGPETYGSPKNCLRLTDYRKVEVLDRQNLLFWGRGDHVWLNRLRTPCVGLRPRATLRFDLHTNQVCNLDSVTAIEISFRFWSRASATCGLGSFEPIAVNQAKALKAALER